MALFLLLEHVPSVTDKAASDLTEVTGVCEVFMWGHLRQPVLFVN